MPPRQSLAKSLSDSPKLSRPGVSRWLLADVRPPSFPHPDPASSKILLTSPNGTQMLTFIFLSVGGKWDVQPGEKEPKFVPFDGSSHPPTSFLKPPTNRSKQKSKVPKTCCPPEPSPAPCPPTTNKRPAWSDWRFWARCRGLISLTCGLCRRIGAVGCLSHISPLWGVYNGAVCGLWTGKRGEETESGIFVFVEKGRKSNVLMMSFTMAGTWAEPIVIQSFGEERSLGCTGSPADSHEVRWCVVSRSPSPDPFARLSLPYPPPNPPTSPHLIKLA